MGLGNEAERLTQRMGDKRILLMGDHGYCRYRRRLMPLVRVEKSSV
jgi:hypothetical protein